jgi:hypothetical protein
MTRAALLSLSFCLLPVLAPAAAAQEGRAPEPTRAAPDVSREIALLNRELGKLRGEVASLKKQVEELRKTQDALGPQVEMLSKHRHTLFLNVMRADTLFPKAKGIYLVTTPSPEDFSRTSGPVSGPK